MTKLLDQNPIFKTKITTICKYLITTWNSNLELKKEDRKTKKHNEIKEDKVDKKIIFLQ